jgi:hypothetical protein
MVIKFAALFFVLAACVETGESAEMLPNRELHLNQPVALTRAQATAPLPWPLNIVLPGKV